MQGQPEANQRVGGAEAESDAKHKVRVGGRGGSRLGHLKQPTGQQEDRGANLKHRHTCQAWICSCTSPHQTRGNNQTCHQPPLPHANHPQPTGLLRSFSLRKKGPEDFLHTSSMPCLAAPPTSSSRERNSNFSVGRIDLNGFQCHLDLCEGWIDLSFESNFQSGWATRGKRRWPACGHHPCLRWSCAQLPCLSGDRLFLGMLGVAI